MLPCVCSVIDHRRRQNVVRTSVTHSAIASCATFLFLPHFDVICDLLLNRRTATWNLFVNLSHLNESWIHCYQLLLSDRWIAWNRTYCLTRYSILISMMDANSLKNLIEKSSDEKKSSRNRGIIKIIRRFLEGMIGELSTFSAIETKCKRTFLFRVKSHVRKYGALTCLLWAPY